MKTGRPTMTDQEPKFRVVIRPNKHREEYSRLADQNLTAEQAARKAEWWRKIGVPARVEEGSTEETDDD